MNRSMIAYPPRKQRSNHKEQHTFIEQASKRSDTKISCLIPTCDREGASMPKE
eukprot:m.281 g.281  ORF g.281 m.281 type:complete len:53 (-) comp218_c0_seq1:51-209(-)